MSRLREPVEPEPAIGPGLRDVIEDVWRPAVTGVTVRVARSRSVSAAVERYVVLPHPARPRLLLPGGDLASARRALSAYRGLRTPRADAWARLIRASVVSSHSATRLLWRLGVFGGPTAPRLLPQLAALLDHRGPLQALLAVRRPGPDSKPTLGLLDAAGEPVAFAKLGRSARTDALVRNEAATLREVAGRLPGLVTPGVLAQTSWQGHPVAVLAPLPPTARRLTREPLDMASTLWAVAASGDLGDAVLDESSYAARLVARLAECARRWPATAEPFRRWWEHLSEPAGALTFGRSHGDWVSWNLGTWRGRVVVWDWESSVPDAPVGFDACHWYFQRARAHADLAAAAAAVDAMAPGLVRLGVSPDDTARVAGLYLLDACVGGVTAADPGSAGAAAVVAELVTLARRRAERLGR